MYRFQKKYLLPMVMIARQNICLANNSNYFKKKPFKTSFGFRIVSLLLYGYHPKLFSIPGYLANQPAHYSIFIKQKKKKNIICLCRKYPPLSLSRDLFSNALPCLQQWVCPLSPVSYFPSPGFRQTVSAHAFSHSLATKIMFVFTYHIILQPKRNKGFSVVLDFLSSSSILAWSHFNTTYY